MNRLQEAMSAVRTNPKSSKAWSDLGDALLERKQLEKAKESYQRALQFDANNEAAQEGIRMTLISDPSVDEAEAPPSSKKPAPEKVTPPPQAPPRKVEPEPEPEPEPEAKPRRRSKVERESSDKPKLADEEKMADDSISLSGALPSNVSAEKEKAIVFRDPPPTPEKPSSGRMWLGIFLILLFNLLCICGPLILVVYQFIL